MSNLPIPFTTEDVIGLFNKLENPPAASNKRELNRLINYCKNHEDLFFIKKIKSDKCIHTSTGDTNEYWAIYFKNKNGKISWDRRFVRHEGFNLLRNLDLLGFDILKKEYTLYHEFVGSKENHEKPFMMVI